MLYTEKGQFSPSLTGKVRAICYAKPDNLTTVVNIKHIIMPAVVGIIMDRAVHFQLPVSFLMVKQLVEQGQCIRENIIIQAAVSQVQP